MERVSERQWEGERVKITDVPVKCKCGWIGTVDDCEPDVNGQGDLGCPLCKQIINVVVVKASQPKPGPSEVKNG